MTDPTTLALRHLTAAADHLAQAAAQIGTMPSPEAQTLSAAIWAMRDELHRNAVLPITRAGE